MLGPQAADQLRHRLADMRAATCVLDLVAGKPRELPGDHPRSMCIELSPNVQIVFCANHLKVPVLVPGDVDWSQVDRIKLVAIEVRHGHQQRLSA